MSIEPGEIRFKNSAVLASLLEVRVEPLLVKIITWISDEYGIMVTEGYRDKRHMNDLHGCTPVRAIDLRQHCYKNDAFAYDIMTAINLRWLYDYTRPTKQVAIIHNSGQGIHFHIQVHPNTRWRYEC